MANETDTEYKIGQVYDMPIDIIRPNPDQPRRSFEREPLEALKLSISRNGLLQPIAVVRLEDGFFVIAAGERRFRAAQELGWQTIPSRIVDGKLEDLSVMENLIREDLNPMERAIAMQHYIDQHNISRKKLSTVLGIARNTISEILSLNRLPPDIQEIIIKDKRYSLHNMRIIARISDPVEQRARFEKLRAKIEHIKDEKAADAKQTKEFKPEVKKDRLTKMTKEVKHLQLNFSKQQLRELRPQVRSLYEQLQALLYKIGDDIQPDE